MKKVELYLFDIDGTLADRDTSKLLLGVGEWFYKNANNHKIALVTNQGGVGLRFWMEGGNEGEAASFGDATKFPTESDVIDHINKVTFNLPGKLSYKYYVCYAYQSKKSGKWSPTPVGKELDSEWNPLFRKPSPGMILQAIVDFDVKRSDVTYIGNSKEDGEAASRAKVSYIDADIFFNRVVDVIEDIPDMNLEKTKEDFVKLNTKFPPKYHGRL